ncbi:MAG: FAD binding domain-containing protein [Ignavibacteria bacterium]|nr:FAD binding domain-containing protein [Ignavibacteria bacterium]
MISKFNYVAPNNLRSALKFLSDKKTNSKILAGGTDIIPGFHIESKRFIDTELLIDIKKIPGLNEIKEKKDYVEIGACVTFSQITESDIIKQYFPLLAKAAETVGSVQIRNRATVVGNFVNNAPCADSVPPLLVYNAKIEIQSLTKKRQIDLQKFLIKPYTTALKKNEIVTKIIIPKPDPDLKGDFYKLGRRRAVAISRISLAVLMKKKNDLIDEIRIASGAVTPIGTRLYDLERFAKGKQANSETYKELAIQMGRLVLEITGLRWSSEYKLPVLQQTFYQLLERINSDEN